MWSFLKKNPSKKIDQKGPEGQEKVECSSDPNCPMCHISDDTIKQLQDTAQESKAPHTSS